MNERISISDIKSKSKYQLLGNYSTAVGAFALYILMVYVIYTVLLGAYSTNVTMGYVTSGTAEAVKSNNLILNFIVSNILSLVVNVFADLIGVGFTLIILKIANGQKSEVKDLFYCFKNHPDKVIIISVVFSFAKILFLLPANIVSLFNDNATLMALNNISLVWVLLLIAGGIVYVLFFLNFALSFLIYINEPQMQAIEIMRKSREYMRGNKIRFVKMILSLIGYYVLAVLSFGIGYLYVAPFTEMMTVNFYKDLAGESNTGAVIDVVIEE